MRDKIVTVFGGSGFLGRAIVQDLAQQGYTIRVATRVPKACYEMRVGGTPGQIVPQLYDPGRPDSIAALVAGSYAVVNCVGILFERGKSKFHAAHTEFPRQLATACKRYGVERFVHISALAVDRAKSRYAKSKLAGEDVVRDLCPLATILRPSVIFGPGDDFFNRFARMAAVLPVLPLIGGGHTRFQPVFVGDVAAAVVRAIESPVGGPDDPRGKTFELGGPDVLDFRGIYNAMFAVTGRPRTLMTLPLALARLQATIFQLFPNPILTKDQLKSLETDNVVTPGLPGLRDLGIVPTGLDVVLPTYLDRFHPGGKYTEKKRD